MADHYTVRSGTDNPILAAPGVRELVITQSVPIGRHEDLDARVVSAVSLLAPVSALVRAADSPADLLL